ncbi:hypothetical protein [Paenibacillus sp. V4I5]|uniref:hypothetical protein n=1 Tax=Paenibacillus sp. V4I5 TaxID=3042306 RepID=UPI002790BDD9|nr:hypothetical protein [Paenibacillus sp. V4I5]MDQ0913882.1 hypothetical protein [Paenibacillus sp. V4I5]
MQRVSKIIIMLIISILTFVSILVVNENYKLKERADSVKHSITLSQIQWDLVQLEGAIAYQIEIHWILPSHVSEKVGDVLQDIMVIREVNSGISVLSKKDEEYLDSLYHRLSDYSHDNMVEPLNELSQNEIEKLIKLRRALRDVGWGVGYSNSGHWDSFIEKLIKLLPQI